jgi:DNA-binding LacI/PurR family transcriptional regulator
VAPRPPPWSAKLSAGRPRRRDPRIPALEELGLLAVVVGHPVGTGSLARRVEGRSAGRTGGSGSPGRSGHRSAARISGPRALRHTRIRATAFEEATRQFGMRLTTVEADCTGEQAAAATREVPAGDPRPPAVLCDNGVMAVSGLGSARDTGLATPADVSMVAWDDSPLCELVQPGLTALIRDVVDYGAQAARRLRELVAG